MVRRHNRSVICTPIVFGAINRDQLTAIRSHVAFRNLAESRVARWLQAGTPTPWTVEEIRTLGIEVFQPDVTPPAIPTIRTYIDRFKE